MERILKITKEIAVDTEEEAVKVLDNARNKANNEGYLLEKWGYTYKTKKAKGEIIAEAWLVRYTETYGGVWDFE